MSANDSSLANMASLGEGSGLQYPQLMNMNFLFPSFDPSGGFGAPPAPGAAAATAVHCEPDAAAGRGQRRVAVAADVPSEPLERELEL